MGMKALVKATKKTPARSGFLSFVFRNLAFLVKRSSSPAAYACPGALPLMVHTIQLSTKYRGHRKISMYHGGEKPSLNWT